MSTRKLKNGDSYKKVVLLLAQTQDFKNLMSKVRRRLDTARIDRHEFSVDWSGTPRGATYVAFGHDEERIEKRVNDSRVYMDVMDVVPEADLQSIISANFGVTRPGARKPEVPTYFCKADRVHEIMKEMVPGILNLSQEVMETKERLNIKLDAAIASEEYQAGLRGSRADHTVEEIKKVLLRFKDASPETLRRALDEFVMHEIMDG